MDYEKQVHQQLDDIIKDINDIINTLKGVQNVQDN